MSFGFLPTTKQKLAWLSDFVIPYLNLKSDKELNDFFLSFHMAELESEEADERQYQDGLSEEYRQAWLAAGNKDYSIDRLFEHFKQSLLTEIQQPDFTEKLRGLWLLANNMMCIPLLSRRGEIIPEDMLLAIPDIEKKIEVLEGGLPKKASYKGFGGIYIQGVPDEEDRTYFRKAEAKSVYAIYTSFFSLPDDNRFIGPGYNKFGKCPNCGTFFEKKRKDQDGCSAACNNNLRQKRFKNKLK